MHFYLNVLISDFTFNDFEFTKVVDSNANQQLMYDFRLCSLKTHVTFYHFQDILIDKYNDTGHWLISEDKAGLEIYRRIIMKPMRTKRITIFWPLVIASQRYELTVFY